MPWRKCGRSNFDRKWKKYRSESNSIESSWLTDIKMLFASNYIWVTISKKEMSKHCATIGTSATEQSQTSTNRYGQISRPMGKLRE